MANGNIRIKQTQRLGLSQPDAPVGGMDAPKQTKGVFKQFSCRDNC
ncbi:MAG: hypothetical protein LBU32_30260 [Clostridiales bacterium]|jgi:hypothetical protein|nr:hypothetical protein [Clostridiales bacterium]